MSFTSIELLKGETATVWPECEQTRSRNGVVKVHLRDIRQAPWPVPHSILRTTHRDYCLRLPLKTRGPGCMVIFLFNGCFCCCVFKSLLRYEHLIHSMGTVWAQYGPIGQLLCFRYPIIVSDFAGMGDFLRAASPSSQAVMRASQQTTLTSAAAPTSCKTHTHAALHPPH